MLNELVIEKEKLK